MFRLTVVALAIAGVLASGAYASDGSPWDALDTIAARVGLIEATDGEQTAALAELETRLGRVEALNAALAGRVLCLERLMRSGRMPHRVFVRRGWPKAVVGLPPCLILRYPAA